MGQSGLSNMQVSEILHSLNTSDSEVKYTNTITKNPEDVELIARKLSAQLNNPSRLNYYYKIAWHLPESKIWYNLELALNGHSPQKLFSWLCAKDMHK